MLLTLCILFQTIFATIASFGTSKISKISNNDSITTIQNGSIREVVAFDSEEDIEKEVLGDDGGSWGIDLLDGLLGLLLFPAKLYPMLLGFLLQSIVVMNT